MSIGMPNPTEQAVDDRGRFTQNVYDALQRAFRELDDRQVAIEDAQTTITAILQALGADDVEALEALGPLLESKQDASDILSELAALAGYGFVTHAGQVFRARVLTGTAGQIDVANGNGFNADPTFSLADVTDVGGGTLQKTAFDAKGRKTGTSAATTDNLPEGVSNLYFTSERAQDAIAAAFVAGTHVGITFTYDDAGNRINVTAAAGGGGGGGVLPMVTGEIVSDMMSVVSIPPAQPVFVHFDDGSLLYSGI